MLTTGPIFVKRVFVIFAVALAVASIPASHADDQSLNSLARKAADPTATFWQLQFENFWEPVRAGGAPWRNQMRVRAVIPLNANDDSGWDHLLRVTTRFRSSGDSDIGIGDTQVFDLIIPRRYAWGSWGIGPLLSLPTASRDEFGTGKYSIGVAAGLSLNNSAMGQWQADFLARYLASIAGDSDREDVRVLSLQPSITYHLASGYYVESEPVFEYSFERDTLELPINIRFGKVFISNERKYNMYAELASTMYSDNDVYTEFGVRLGFRFLFRE